MTGLDRCHGRLGQEAICAITDAHPRGKSDARQAKKGWRHSVVLDLSHSSHGAGGGGRLEVAQCLYSERRAASESLLVKWENGRKRTAWANVE
jgi:hypothetical protein